MTLFALCNLANFNPRLQKNRMKYRSCLLAILLAVMGLATATRAFSQEPAADKEQAYTRTINERAAKIVASLVLSGNDKSERLTKLVAGQYRALNDIHTSRNNQIKTLTTSGAPKETVDAQAKQLESEADTKLDALHASYLSALSAELSPAQVDQIKDGMTYGVLNVTYKGYLDMLPNLTDKQKEQIMTWLAEAREHAMDAESSEKKHAWFGKYKGRINNYLSAAGYDLKKEGEEWEKRRNAAKQTKINSH